MSSKTCGDSIRSMTMIGDVSYAFVSAYDSYSFCKQCDGQYYKRRLVLECFIMRWWCCSLDKLAVLCDIMDLLSWAENAVYLDDCIFEVCRKNITPYIVMPKGHGNGKHCWILGSLTMQGWSGVSVHGTSDTKKVSVTSIGYPTLDGTKDGASPQFYETLQLGYCHTSFLIHKSW